MAIEFAVQRLGIGDVVLVGLPGQAEKVEATVVRDIDRTETTVRATLRVEGREDFVKEWPLGELVTVVRGPRKPVAWCAVRRLTSPTMSTCAACSTATTSRRVTARGAERPQPSPLSQRLRSAPTASIDRRRHLVRRARTLVV
jgi:hypothetical protein